MSAVPENIHPPTRPLRLLTMKQVTQLVPFHRVYIYRLIARGEFPQPVKIGKRRNGWVASEVEAWIEARVAQRDDQLVRDDDGEVHPVPHREVAEAAGDN